MQIQHRKNSGFTLVELMIVVAVIGLLAAIAIPNMARARTTTQTNACINNLSKIDGAKQEWGMDNNVSVTAKPGSAELQPYLGRGANGELPTCPIDPQQTFDTSYTAGNLPTIPGCKISPATHLLGSPASPSSGAPTNPSLN